MNAVLVVLGVLVLIGLGYVAVQLRGVLGGATATSPSASVAGSGSVTQDDHAAADVEPDASTVAALEERERGIAARESAFLTRQASLASFEGRLSEMTQSLAAQQGELAHREQVLTAREQAVETAAATAGTSPTPTSSAPDGPALAVIRADLEAQVRAEVEDTVRAEVEDTVRAEVEDTVRAEVEDTVRAEAAETTARLAEQVAATTAREAATVDREEALVQRSERLATRADRLSHREDQLTHREDLAAKDAVRLEERRGQLEGELADVRAATEALAARGREHVLELERIAGLTAADAATELTKSIEEQAKRTAAITVRELEADARSEGDRRAREIVSQAIQRVASAQTSESVVSVIHLPGDDMKGRIIGREGRNIRTFETLTGVNVLIDDTPEAVSLSCFDPVRREIARVTLGALVADGRIHPQRIEDAYAQAKGEVEAAIEVTGRDTLIDVGLDDAHPELVTLLGRLKFRTSYGQNVLGHLVETAHIASGMAAELGLGKNGIAVVKRAAFFHDIGKALTHEVEGSHALIGAEVARRCGESEEVVHAIGAHHLEIAPQTVEAWLTIGSDSCSGGRPGARRESLEAYVERLKRIEEIAYSRDGVERVFAMSAGRELRVMVLPDQVDDLGSQVLARDIAKQIEDELTYPGQIRVTVIRESRASETAH